MQTRARNRNLLVFLFISMFTVHQLPARIPLGQLRGTYDIVEEGYKRISPLNGATLWYSRNIKNIHRLGKEHYLYPLVASLFNYVPGQFTITQNSKYPASYLDAQSIARIIIKIEEFIKANTRILTKKQTDELRTLIVNEINLKKMERPLPKNIEALINGMEIAFNKSGYFDNKPNLFKYGLHTMLLAFLYEKGESANDFKKYFDEFGLTYLKKEFTITAPYTIDVIPKIEEKFLQKPTGISPATLHGNASFEEYIYAFIMKAHFLSPFVEATGYKNANYKVDKFTWYFPDCMETTIRDLCNNIVRVLATLIFDPQQQASDLKLKWVIDKKLENFYKNYPDLDSTGMPIAHYNWTNVVSNRQFIAYKRINDLNKPTTKGIQIKRNVEGFVIVENLEKQINSLDEAKKGMFASKEYKGYEFIELTTGKRKYYLFDPQEQPNLVAYEIRPSVRNLITMLNHLFGLDIFEKTKPQETWLEKTLLKTNFNSTYIKPTFEKVDLPNIETSMGNIDLDDLTKKQIVVAAKKNKSQIVLTLSATHGYATVTIGPLENKLVLTDKLLPIFANKNLPISFKNYLLFTLNKPGRKQVMYLTFYKTIPLLDLLLNLDLSSERDRIEAIIRLLDKEIINKLIASKDKSTIKLIPIIKQFWVNLIKTIPVVDGGNQLSILESLTSVKYIREALLSPEYQDFKNEAFLAFFLMYFVTLVSAPKAEVLWDNNESNSIMKAIEAAEKKRHATYMIGIAYLLKVLLKKKNSKAIKIAEKIASRFMTKDAPVGLFYPAILILIDLVENVYSQGSTEEKTKFIKQFENHLKKIKFFTRKKDLPEKLQLSLVNLFIAVIQNSLVKDKKVERAIFKSMKAYIDGLESSQETFPKALPIILVKFVQNKTINENEFFLTINKLTLREFSNDFAIMELLRLSLEKNIISEHDKILDLIEKIAAKYIGFKVHKEAINFLITFKNKKLINLDNLAQVCRLISFMLIANRHMESWIPIPPLYTENQARLTTLITELQKEKILQKGIETFLIVQKIKESLYQMEDEWKNCYTIKQIEEFEKLFKKYSIKQIEELQALIYKNFFTKDVHQLTIQFFEDLKKEQWYRKETRELIEKLAQILADSFK